MGLINILKKGNRRKQEEKYHSDTLSSMAVLPASVNVSLISSRVKQVFTIYLNASYNLAPELLPMADMEEQFYYDAMQRIYVEADRLADCLVSERQVSTAVIIDLRMEDYDNSLVYAVRSLTYIATYQVNGTMSCPDGIHDFEETGRVCIKFINDTRVGWLLAAVEER